MKRDEGSVTVMCLCGWGGRCVTLGEERWAGEFLERVLREIFGSEEEETERDRRKLHSEEFQQLAGCCEHCHELVSRYSFRELSYMSITKQQICSYNIYVFSATCFGSGPPCSWSI
jgi:hypothetical protein